MPFLISVLKRWGFKSIPGNIVSSRLAWTIVDPVSKGKKKSDKNEFCPGNTHPIKDRKC